MTDTDDGLARARRTRTTVYATIIGASLLLGGGVAYAAATSVPAPVTKACVNKSTHAVAMLRPCKSTETKVTWPSQQGVFSSGRYVAATMAVPVWIKSTTAVTDGPTLVTIPFTVYGEGPQIVTIKFDRGAGNRPSDLGPYTCANPASGLGTDEIDTLNATESIDGSDGDFPRYLMPGQHIFTLIAQQFGCQDATTPTGTVKGIDLTFSVTQIPTTSQ